MVVVVTAMVILNVIVIAIVIMLCQGCPVGRREIVTGFSSPLVCTFNPALQCIHATYIHATYIHATYIHATCHTHHDMPHHDSLQQDAGCGYSTPQQYAQAWDFQTSSSSAYNISMYYNNSDLPYENQQPFRLQRVNAVRRVMLKHVLRTHWTQ